MIEKLDAAHNRAHFDCGVDSLNDFIRTLALQQQKRGINVTFVAVEDPGDDRVLGYYTLSMDRIESVTVPGGPTIRVLPVVLLGRLATDVSTRGVGLGRRLLMHALSRAYNVGTSEIGAWGVIVDALDDGASAFYRKYGFRETLDDPHRLFVSMKTIKQLGLITR